MVDFVPKILEQILKISYMTLFFIVPHDAQCSKTYVKIVFIFLSLTKIFIIGFWDFNVFLTKKIKENFSSQILLASRTKCGIFR